MSDAAQTWPGDVCRAMSEVARELDAARQKFAPFNSGHEGYAVIREELDELWDEVKRDDMTAAKREAVQVAAMALRFIVDLDDGGNPAKREAMVPRAALEWLAKRTASEWGVGCPSGVFLCEDEHAEHGDSECVDCWITAALKAAEEVTPDAK